MWRQLGFGSGFGGTAERSRKSWWRKSPGPDSHEGSGGGSGGSGGKSWSSGVSSGDSEELGVGGGSAGVPAWLTRGLCPENLAVWGPEDWWAPGDEEDGPLALDMDPVGSYNWDWEAWLPTIVVPGRAKVYGAWRGGVLELKDEEMVADEDTYRNPLAPMEPLIVATRLLSPQLDLGSVDLIADLNSLKHLARFLLGFPDQGQSSGLAAAGLGASGCGSGTGADSFRLGLQTLGSIVGESQQGPVVLIRHEERFTAKWIGYGAAFVRACLRAPVAEDLAGPFKQVSLLRLPGLNVLVRHKISAVIPEAWEEEGGDLGRTGRVEPPSTRHRLETSLRVRRNTFPDLRAKERIIFGSLGLSCDRLSVDKWLDLLFTQAQHLCLGRHMRGDFKRTEWLTEAGVKALLPPPLRPHLSPGALTRRLARLLGHLTQRTQALAKQGDLALLLLPAQPLPQPPHSPATSDSSLPQAKLKAPAAHSPPKLLLRLQTRRDLASVSPALVRQLLHQSSPNLPQPHTNTLPNSNNCSSNEHFFHPNPTTTPSAQKQCEKL